MSSYLSTYLLISIPLMWTSFLANIQSISQPLKAHTSYALFFVLPLTISLAGLPPLTGFAPKLFALLALPSTFFALILLFASLINLSYYLNFFFSISLSGMKSSMNQPFTFFPTFLVILVLFGLLPIPLFFLTPLM